MQLRSNLVVLALLALFFTDAVNGNGCGGSLSGDGGEFEMTPDTNFNGDLECVWVIKLLSRQSITFTLNQLGGSSPATVSLYPEHEASETVLNPIRLTSSDVGQTVQAPGQSLVVVLTRTDISTGVSFSWDSVSAGPSETLTETNYIDSSSGRVLWNRFYAPEKLTWVLNLDSAQTVAFNSEIQFEQCQAFNPCECSYFGLYEVTSAGYLREVTRVCGRSLSFKADDLSSKLVAFVYINSTSVVPRSNLVEVSWSVKSQVTPPTDLTDAPTTEPGITVTPDPSTIYLACDGIITLPELGESITIAYKYGETYENMENCLWPMYPAGAEYPSLDVTLVDHGFHDDSDGVATFSDYFDPRVAVKGKTYPFSSGHKFLSFTSDCSGTGTGFLMKMTTRQLLDSSSIVLGRQTYSTIPGVATYGPYGNYERAVIVIQPLDRPITVGVEYFHIAYAVSCTVDYLEIYEIGNLGGAVRKAGKLCGEGSVLSNVFKTKKPVVASFYAGKSLGGSGFQISWNSTETS